MDSTLIFGHKNPDTDSVCSAISYAHLKNKLGEKSTPARLGSLSKETEYVLNYFSVEPPKLIETVSPQIGDLTHVEKEYINLKDSLKEALDLLTKEKFSSLPVVNDKHALVGMLHVSDVANTYLNLDYQDLFIKYTSTYENILKVLGGNVVSGVLPNGKIDGQLKAASEFDTVNKGDIVVTTTAVDGIDRAISAGASLIIVCAKEDDFIVPRVDTKCAIIKVKSHLFKTLRLITQSISVESVLKKSKFFHFKEEDYLDEIKDIMKESQQTNFPVVGKDGKLFGTIRSKNLINFTRKNVILVDHNERGQSVDGIKDAKILEIVDHHKFGNFETNEPLTIRAATVGCSCTIIYKLYKEAGVTPSKEMAGLMASAILSDTLIFKSPTCTKDDVEAATELCKIAKIDIKKYGMDMLIAGTSLSEKTPLEIIEMDNKSFTMGGLNVSVSQINSVDVEGVLKNREKLQKVMSEKIESNGFNLFLLVITDIVNSGSQILVLGDSVDIVDTAFEVEVVDGTAWLDGVVSRKKQIVPALMGAVQG